MSEFYEQMRKDAENYKPAKEISQNVLYYKNMALMSPHFKDIREEKPECISEPLLNACMQLAYEKGRTGIEQASYDRGYYKAWQEVAEKLGMQYEI